MDPIFPGQVKAQIKKFWDAFTRKSAIGLRELYSPAATVFSADSLGSEPAGPMLARREREFFGAKSSVSVRVDEVVVQLLTPRLAVASYPFHLLAVRRLPDGKRVRIDLPFGRATQIFQRDEDGVCRIIHEHLSSAEPVLAKGLPDGPNSTASH